MKQEIPWNRFVVEAVVIVGSILLAFAIDAGWNQRQERLSEIELLEVIKSDMEKNLDEIDRVIARNTSSEGKIRKFMLGSAETLSNLSYEEAQPIISMVAVATIGYFRGSLASTDLALIQDIQIRNILGTWEGVASDAIEESPLRWETMGQLLELGAPSGLMLFMNSRGNAIPENVPGGIPSPALVLSKLREDEDFVNVLLKSNTWASNSTRKARIVREATVAVIEEINSYLTN